MVVGTDPQGNPLTDGDGAFVARTQPDGTYTLVDARNTGGTTTVAASVDGEWRTATLYEMPSNDRSPNLRFYRNVFTANITFPALPPPAPPPVVSIFVMEEAGGQRRLVRDGLALEDSSSRHRLPGERGRGRQRGDDRGLGLFGPRGRLARERAPGHGLRPRRPLHSGPARHLHRHRDAPAGLRASGHGLEQLPRDRGWWRHRQPARRAAGGDWGCDGSPSRVYRRPDLGLPPHLLQRAGAERPRQHPDRGRNG